MSQELKSERFVVNQAVIMLRSPLLWPSASPRQVRYVGDSLVPESRGGKWLRLSCFDMVRLMLALKLVRFGLEAAPASAVVRHTIEDVTLCGEPGDGLKEAIVDLPSLYRDQIFVVHSRRHDGWQGKLITPEFFNEDFPKELSQHGTFLLPLRSEVELLARRIREEAFSDVEA